MASYFGRRDFGDPRNNFGRPVPPLDIPANFPGQSSFPALRSGRTHPAPGLDSLSSCRHNRGCAAAPRRSAQEELTFDQGRCPAAIPSQRPHASSRCSTPCSTPRSTPRSAPRSTPRSTHGSTPRSTPRSFPRSQEPRPAIDPGVAELIRLGFPRHAAEAAFRRVSSLADTHVEDRGANAHTATAEDKRSLSNRAEGSDIGIFAQLRLRFEN
jgi:hypothetical protein